MDKLYLILSQMKASFDELEAIMIEEVNQLSRPQINPVSLQVLTDNKSQLLSTLQYYDEMRRQEETTQGINAPYSQKTKLSASWREITEKVERTKGLNIRVEELLNMHMKKNQQIKKVVEGAGGGNSLYGSAGESNATPMGRVYNISV